VTPLLHPGFGTEGDSLLDRTRLTAYGLQFAGLGAPLGPTEMQLQDLSPDRWMKCQIMRAKPVAATQNLLISRLHCMNELHPPTL
jgi:hypothetical protein